MRRPLIRAGTIRTYTSRAPPAHGSSRVVGFEADLAVGVYSEQRARDGAEDDGLSRYREIDQQDHDPVRGGEPGAAGAAGFLVAAVRRLPALPSFR